LELLIKTMKGDVAYFEDIQFVSAGHISFGGYFFFNNSSRVSAFNGYQVISSLFIFWSAGAINLELSIPFLSLYVVKMNWLANKLGKI